MKGGLLRAEPLHGQGVQHARHPRQFHFTGLDAHPDIADNAFERFPEVVRFCRPRPLSAGSANPMTSA